MSDTIGRFEIRSELGRGSQSVVYLAWDPQLQREVAIKTLHFDGSNAEENAVLLDEARMVSRLRHPNAVPIYDAGEQDGDLYLVFEYVEGRSLLEALEAEGRMPAPKAANFMRQVLDAVAQAHALGIIHRDLKPSNILIDRQGVPKVMDFGIASRLPEAGRENSRELIGTPAYMAPEYITLHLVSEKMDVFAAGLILLEMITGQRVFQGGGAETLLYRIACEPVTLPREAGIDDVLGNIILRACALDPAHRFATAAEMRQALDNYLGSALAPPTAAAMIPPAAAALALSGMSSARSDASNERPAAAHRRPRLKMAPRWVLMPPVAVSMSASAAIPSRCRAVKPARSAPAAAIRGK